MLSEGQVAAFAMAVFFRGMATDERIALTGAMARSGRRIDWRGVGLDRPAIDKHSTGGVGDKVSLALAPLVASCGVAVPMISGRGLGHTGGTLDKLEAIPGYDAAPSAERFIRHGAPGRLRDHRPDRRSGARRPAALCDPRRHRDRRVESR
ncbi:MAG: hypothetical protein WDO24_24585 [Pseudomonadota bacterium]